MARGVTTRSKVQVGKTGQVIITVPRPLASAMGLDKGVEVEWKVAGAGKLEIHLIK